MSAHTCHATGCPSAVPPRMLMCAHHWRMVPRLEQAAVWATYVPGQERRKDPTREYLKSRVVLTVDPPTGNVTIGLRSGDRITTAASMPDVCKIIAEHKARLTVAA